MDSSYIFTIEESVRRTVKQFKDALNADRRDFERYKAADYRKVKTVERWESKLTAYMDAFNDLDYLFQRAITVDHERSTYNHQIHHLKNDVKRLKAYLNILSVAKKIEIEEQVKFRTEQRINALCNQANLELKNELEQFKQAHSSETNDTERRVA